MQTHYKPFTRARLLVEARAGLASSSRGLQTQYLFIQVYPSANEVAGRLASINKKRPLPCVGPAAFALDDWNAVVWSLPNGSRLRWIRTCLDPKRFSRFQHEVGLDPGASLAPAPPPQLIRYVPRRRALFRYTPLGGSTLYIKYYGLGEDAIPAANLAQFGEISARNNLGFIAPRMVLHSTRIRAVIAEEVPGVPMTTLLANLEPSVVAAVGRAVAGLHKSKLAPMLVWTPKAERRALDNAMSEIARALPGLAPELRHVLDRIDRHMIRLTFDRQTPVHGNLFGDQILINGTQVAIVDWDDLALGDPLFDVGRLIAHIAFASGAHPEARAALIAAAATLLDAYIHEANTALDMDRLRWQVAVALLMRAKISALRILSPTWIADIQGALAEASLVLDGRSAWLPAADI